MLEIVLSGPGQHKAPLLAALDSNGVQVPLSAQRAVNPSYHLPTEDGIEWITCFAPDLAGVEKALGRFKTWRLRMHHRKQDVIVPHSPLAELQAHVAELEKRLEARGL